MVVSLSSKQGVIGFLNAVKFPFEMSVCPMSASSQCLQLCRKFKHCKRWYASKVSAQSKSLDFPLMQMVTANNQMGVLEDLITPLARTPYDAQIIFKEGIVRNFVKELRQRSVLKYQVEILPIEPSPVINHYRHKDELNFRVGLDGDPKTLGFFTGRPQFGEIYAVRPDNLINVKEEHKLVARVLEDFVKKSPLPPCYLLNDGGYWRQLILRSNQKGDIMAIVTAHPQDRCPEEIEVEQRELAQHFENSGVKLHSLYHLLSKHVKSTSDNSILSLVKGEPYIIESLLDKEYRISPHSFFQINVKAAEVMYREVGALASFSASTSLLDLCCGVGTFSISFKDQVRHCVGIESSRSSMEDALANCKINGATNCEFMFGKVEDRLNSVLEMMENVGNIVVIANPGRSGLHPRVIEILRHNPAIHRIIYVSCDPDNRFTQRNFVDLLKSGKKITGKPFVLKKIKPIDMFPHTFHYEMILVFER